MRNDTTRNARALRRSRCTVRWAVALVCALTEAYATNAQEPESSTPIPSTPTASTPLISPQDSLGTGLIDSPLEIPVEVFSGTKLNEGALSGGGSGHRIVAESNDLDWWHERVSQAILKEDRWVAFDLPTVLMDTLQNSPLIKSVAAEASIALERSVQQDAAFDTAALFKSRVGRTNDPVGNTLTTGGPDRLIDLTWDNSAGIQKLGRTGTKVDLSQAMNFNDSNSLFFQPANQANARLSLSLTQPLYAGRGQVFNERLLTQARLDSAITWQQMRQSVEQRIADVMASYWRLYEVRCHFEQQRALIGRGEELESIVLGRRDFDTGPLEISKIRQRLARRNDRLIELKASIQLEQAQLAALTGSASLSGISLHGAGGLSVDRLEMIPQMQGHPSDIEVTLYDGMFRGLSYRPEIQAAAADLEAAALGIAVSKNQLLPQLDAVVETYLAGLRGDTRFGDAFIGQFADSGPGVAAGVQYDLPVGRRFVRSRYREAHHRYRQKAEELRETMLRVQGEIESALIQLRRASDQRASKQRLLETSIDEERILTRRWEMMIADTTNVGTLLETVLDAQQRRSDAEREWLSAHIAYRIALVRLDQATGTLLIQEGIEPERDSCGSDVHFIDAKAAAEGMVEMPAEVDGFSPLAVEPMLHTDSTMNAPPASLTLPMAGDRPTGDESLQAPGISASPPLWMPTKPQENQP